MKTYTIQIQQTIVVSKEIKANDIQEALDKAQDIIDYGLHLVKPVKGWTEEWVDYSECVGVF